MGLCGSELHTREQYMCMYARVCVFWICRIHCGWEYIFRVPQLPISSVAIEESTDSVSINQFFSCKTKSKSSEWNLSSVIRCACWFWCDIFVLWQSFKIQTIDSLFCFPKIFNDEVTAPDPKLGIANAVIFTIKRALTPKILQYVTQFILCNKGPFLHSLVIFTGPPNCHF